MSSSNKPESALAPPTSRLLSTCSRDQPSLEKLELLVKFRGYIIFTATRYESIHDVRFKMCMDMLSECRNYATAVVVVDSSPNEEVYEALRSSGAMLHRQTAVGRKGAALREAACIASQLPGVTQDTIMCWQEPEKINMVKHWREVQKAPDADVIVPYRSLKLFQETYPIEQYHSEVYGNLFLDAVARQELQKLHKDLPTVDATIAKEMGTSQCQLPLIDWHFGPFAFRAKHVKLWTLFQDGDMYDAQLVPIVHAMRKGLSVSSILVNFEAPHEMKLQEEGNVDFIEKRLNQLKDLDPRVKQAWTDEYYC